MKNKQFYMVSVDGREAPSVIHQTLADATKEAIRLSGLMENRSRCVRVLQLFGTYVPSKSHEWVQA